MSPSLEPELQQRGIIDAAQDPNSSVTAADARQEIVKESKKAGVSAFEFNPDASPEEKAAQARAVSLPFSFLSVGTYELIEERRE